MYVINIRSSSLNAFDRCEHKYWLSYVLGIPEQANLAADLGNVVHKALECIAAWKKAYQDKHEEFNVDGVGTLNLKNGADLDHVLQLAYDYYAKLSPHHNWGTKELKTAKTLLQNCLKWKHGIYDPRNRHILTPEYKFDFPIPKQWAEYHYEIADQELRGLIRIRGTIDLVTKIDDDTIEIIDWKTGARKDWNKDKPKEHRDLKQDIQLKLYYYAAKKLFPSYKHILLTIFFIKSQEPFTLSWEDEEVAQTETELKNYCQNIRQVQNPKLSIKWQCKFCHYQKTNHTDTQMTMCQFMKQEVDTKGLVQCQLEYGRADSLSHYDGGGRKE